MSKIESEGFGNTCISPKKVSDVVRRVVTVAVHSSIVTDPKRPNKREHQWGLGYYQESYVEGNRLNLVDHGTLWNPADLWCVVDAILKRERSVHIIGPQIGVTLTMTKFWEELESQNYYLMSPEWRMRGLKKYSSEMLTKGVFCIEDPPIIITCWNGSTRGKATILDLANYTVTPVEQLIGEMGMGEAMPIEQDMPSLSLSAALQQRCEATEKVIEGLLRIATESKCTTIRATASACAYDAFLRKYHDGSIHYHNHSEAKELERHSVYGGICEVFQHGTVEEELYVMDVNSLYPYVMSIEPMPVKLLGMGDSIDLPDVPNVLDDNGIIAECRIATDSYVFPKRTNNGTIYCRGDYWTVLPTPEFLAAWDLGLIKEVRRHCLYQMGMPFGGFINHLYDIRLCSSRAGNKGMGSVAKLLLNGFAGRFAKRDFRWVDDPEETAIMPWGVWAHVRSGETLPSYYRAVNWNVQRLNAPCEGKESIPAIYAHVTSAARCHMRYLIDVAEECNVYYIDTDSLHVGVEGRKNLEIMGYLDNYAIGRLKTERAGYCAHYYGIKDYNFDGTVVVGGMSSKVDDRHSRSPDVWVYPRLQSLLHYRPDGTITGEKIKLNLNPCHVKGTVDETGRVTPYTVREDYAEFRQLLSSQAAMSCGGNTAKYRGNARQEIGGKIHRPETGNS